MWAASDGVATFAFVQLLFADIVVSFTFEIRVGFSCLFLHCAMALLFYTAGHWDCGFCSCWLLRLPCPICILGICWHTDTKNTHIYLGSLAFMSIGARPFPFHFRYCKTFRIKYISLPTFVSFHFEAKPLLSWLSFLVFALQQSCLLLLFQVLYAPCAIIAVVSFIVQVQA